MNDTPSGPESPTPPTRTEMIDDILLELLAGGFNHTEAAEFAHCSTKTVQRRLRDPEFTTELARLRAIRLDDITGRLNRLTTRAIGVLEDTLDADIPQLRFRAATTVMSLALRMRDEHETEARLNQLERYASLMPKTPHEPWQQTSHP